MSENKISQMPWYLDDTYNQDENISLIGADKKQIGNLFQDGCGNGDKTPGNAKAIISAVNNTYGAGISPESVPELVAAMKEMMECFDAEGGWISDACLIRCKTALEKSKL